MEYIYGLYNGTCRWLVSNKKKAKNALEQKILFFFKFQEKKLNKCRKIKGS